MRKLLLALLAIALLAYLLPPKAPKTQIQSQGTIVKMYNHLTGQIQPIPLEEYLIGVVAAEMPASFPVEALKAQAVAARTYIMQRLAPGGVQNARRPAADVSSDPREGQAWISREEMQKRWGKIKSLEYYYKIKWAVDSTRGQVITYKSQLIFPAFHASCGGGTENAEEVWVTAAPYLKGVPCPHCADPDPERQVTYTLAELDKKLKTNLSAMPVSTIKNKALAVIQETATGRPKEIRIGDKTYPATMLRELLNLRSTRISWSIEGDQITFTTRGYGHGVGLCQYGAKGMALQGKSYEQILKHYYTGVEITTIPPAGA
ncbi:stage II sporulation protein D [Desulforamulus putei]|uniref:Stage II sporulation protein D n=1 Tax=Desulforamulus putei DSM 12395 TaxID=1121429 RepID=A0A1M4XTL8_9FIRM|nr:stage II sporulation protein D [Desulforamulus putei]SHE96613.1 stage II sporulation protein D [Desulforamulus putei DSM 12395]